MAKHSEVDRQGVSWGKFTVVVNTIIYSTVLPFLHINLEIFNEFEIKLMQVHLLSGGSVGPCPMMPSDPER